LELHDTSKKSYSVVKGGYPDTTTKTRIDANGLELYLAEFRKSQFVSESFINNFRAYFLEIDKQLSTLPIGHDLQKLPVIGLDSDPVLLTFEPEMILDHIKESKITNTYIIYKKALVRLYISKYIAMVFVLSKINDQWKIDYLGGDATGKDSFFKQ
jgi:hypothetical protein